MRWLYVQVKNYRQRGIKAQFSTAKPIICAKCKNGEDLRNIFFDVKSRIVCYLLKKAVVFVQSV